MTFVNIFDKISPGAVVNLNISSQLSFSEGPQYSKKVDFLTSKLPVPIFWDLFYMRF